MLVEEIVMNSDGQKRQECLWLLSFALETKIRLGDPLEYKLDFELR